ncbi:MAG: hypothetical protein CM15mP68_0280 [Pseudomonadota bacterium]|nr:MAG: hypothetical protein CM15mP68_0280 [Pseudomonadota bacterium]
MSWCICWTTLTLRWSFTKPVTPCDMGNPERLPKVKLLVQIDDGTEALLKGAVDYERAIRDHAPLARQTQTRSYLYALYRRYNRHAQGRDVSVGILTYFIASGATGRELQPPESMGEFADYLQLIEQPPISLPACPLMHGTGMWLGSFYLCCWVAQW